VEDDSYIWVEVLADGDLLRGERLLRSLLSDLSDIPGIEVRPPADNPPPPDGTKGVGDIADASMWIFLSAGVQAGARVLVTAIQAWAQRERHRAVRITRGNRSIELPSALSPAQERAIEAFLRDEKR